MEANIKDIAIATGFSINTVSRSLRDDRAISAKTRNLIKEKAEELNYIPNALASSMRSLHSGLIGVIYAAKNSHACVWDDSSFFILTNN